MIMNAQMGVDPRNKINDLTNDEWRNLASSVRIGSDEKELLVNCKSILDRTKEELIQKIGIENYQKIWGETFSDAVIYPYVLPDRFVKEHPAPFDLREIEDHIRLFTKKKEIVLDMFNGSGTTLVAAYKTGRCGAGIELMDHFFDLTVRRISSYTGSPYQYGENNLWLHKGDCRDVMPIIKNAKVDAIISSPPYYKILKKSTGERALARKSQGLLANYGNSLNDLGNIEHYRTFMQEMSKIYSQCYRVLRNGKYMVIIVSDIFADGRFIPYGTDTIQIIQSVGFKCQGIQVVLDTWKTKGPYGIPYRLSFRFNHHYALIFQKI